MPAAAMPAAAMPAAVAAAPAPGPRTLMTPRPPIALTPDSLPLAIAQRMPTIIRTTNDELEVRLHGWSGRATGWWVPSLHRRRSRCRSPWCPCSPKGEMRSRSCCCRPTTGCQLRTRHRRQPGSLRPSTRVAEFRAAIAVGAARGASATTRPTRPSSRGMATRQPIPPKRRRLRPRPPSRSHDLRSTTRVPSTDHVERRTHPVRPPPPRPLSQRPEWCAPEHQTTPSEPLRCLRRLGSEGFGAFRSGSAPQHAQTPGSPIEWLVSTSLPSRVQQPTVGCSPRRSERPSDTPRAIRVRLGRRTGIFCLVGRCGWS